MGEKYVQEEFLGAKYVQEEFLGEESLGEKYMGEKYVQEGFLGDEVWVKNIGEHRDIDGMLAFVPPFSGYIIEGSLEVKLPTIWTVEKQR